MKRRNKMAKELLYKQNIKIEKFHNILSPKGMNSVLKRTLVLLCINLLFGQKVFSVDYVNQADVKVFVTDYPNQADLLVYKVKYVNQAGENNGKWFFVKYSNQSDKKIFFVSYPNQADVKIHFVKYPNRAKWTQNEKKYLFY
jgi:hypothetical protein